MHIERGLGPKSNFEVFFRAQRDLIVYQISNWSNTPFRFFANKSYILKQYLEEIFVLQSFYSFSPVKTCLFKFDKLNWETNPLYFARQNFYLCDRADWNGCNTCSLYVCICVTVYLCILPRSIFIFVIVQIVFV